MIGTKNSFLTHLLTNRPRARWIYPFFITTKTATTLLAGTEAAPSRIPIIITGDKDAVRILTHLTITLGSTLTNMGVRLSIAHKDHALSPQIEVNLPSRVFMGTGQRPHELPYPIILWENDTLLIDLRNFAAGSGNVWVTASGIAIQKASLSDKFRNDLVESSKITPIFLSTKVDINSNLFNKAFLGMQGVSVEKDIYVTRLLGISIDSGGSDGEVYVRPKTENYLCLDGVSSKDLLALGDYYHDYFPLKVDKHIGMEFEVENRTALTQTLHLIAEGLLMPGGDSYGRMGKPTPTRKTKAGLSLSC